MVLTDGWQKKVCALIRIADVAHIDEVDDVGAFYAEDQVAIVKEILLYRMSGVEMGRNEIEEVVCMQLQRHNIKAWWDIQALVTSICSTLGITEQEGIWHG